MGWSFLTSRNLWTEVTYHKDIWQHHLTDWIHIPTWPRTWISIVWKAILHSMPNMRAGLAWKINEGNMTRIGMDSWTGGHNMHQLPPELIHFLNQRHSKVITQIADMENNSIFKQAWFFARHLGIPEHSQ